MARDPRVAEIIIGFIWAGHELDPVGRNLISRPVKIVCAHSNMLNTLAVITFKIIDNLTRLATILVDRNSNATAGRSQRPTDKTSKFTINLKKSDLTEIEQVSIKLRPTVHIPLKHIMRQMVEVMKPNPLRHIRAQTIKLFCKRIIFSVKRDKI